MLFTKTSDRAEAEAASLRQAGHPGVVDLVDVDVDQGVVRTRWVEGRPLAEVGSLSLEEIAGVAAAIASTLADLHERGLHHGGVDTSHVLITPEGQPVLCSLGRPGHAADDVAAWGRLLNELVASGPFGDNEGRAPARQGRRPGLGAMLAPPARATLAELATAASAPERDRRPAAADLATQIRERIPTCRLPRPHPTRLLAPDLTRPTGARAPAWRTRRARVVVTSILVAAALTLVLGGTVMGGNRTSPAAAPAEVDDKPATMTGSKPPPSSVSTTPVTEPRAQRVWPRERIDFHDGVLSLDGVRYQVGTQGDVVVRGEWACREPATAVLLRPATGDVYAFDAWAQPGSDVTGRSVGRFPGATDLRVTDADADGCADLQALSPIAAPQSVAMFEVAGP